MDNLNEDLNVIVMYLELKIKDKRGNASFESGYNLIGVFWKVR